MSFRFGDAQQAIGVRISPSGFFSTPVFLFLHLILGLFDSAVMVYTVKHSFVFEWPVWFARAWYR